MPRMTRKDQIEATDPQPPGEPDPTTLPGGPGYEHPSLPPATPPPSDPISPVPGDGPAPAPAPVTPVAPAPPIAAPPGQVGDPGTPLGGGTLERPGGEAGRPFRSMDFFTNRMVSGPGGGRRPVGMPEGGVVGPMGAGGTASEQDVLDPEGGGVSPDVLRRLFSSVLQGQGGGGGY